MLTKALLIIITAHKHPYWFATYKHHQTTQAQHMKTFKKSLNKVKYI